MGRPSKCQCGAHATGTIEVANDISGTGTLTKQGAGILTLSGNNSYTGQTSIGAGTLKLATLGGTMSRLALVLVPALALAPSIAFAQEAAAAPEAAPAQAAPSESHSAMFARMQERIRNTPTSTILTTSVISSVGFGPELLWGAGLQMRLDPAVFPGADIS